MLENVEPFTDSDEMWFGKHKGKSLADVPASYLDWWLGSENTESTLKLVAYIMGHRGQLNLEMESDDDLETPF
tara:strand:- start:988 stop:1206 length:219 start_codon:yes stop_codon:yes gene_type:complete